MVVVVSDRAHFQQRGAGTFLIGSLGKYLDPSREKRYEVIFSAWPISYYYPSSPLDPRRSDHDDDVPITAIADEGNLPILY